MQKRPLSIYLFSAFIIMVSLTMAIPSPARSSGRLEQARPWLGVAIDKGKSGVLVKDALPGTPAAAAGMQAGDEITAVDQTAVTSPEMLIKTVQSRGVGNEVTVHWLRAGKKMSVKVKLVARPDELELLRQRIVGKEVPEFDLKVAHGGGSGKSADLKGKVTLIEFWATWCPACVASHADLNQFVRKHGSKVNVLTITDDADEPLKKYIAQAKPAFTILQDTEHKTQGPFYVSAIPMICVIGRDGRIAFATTGAGTYLREALEKALELAASP